MSIISKITASVTARFIQPYCLSHYDRTKFGKKLSKYKDSYIGKRCFLIGNGPSLKADDLTRLDMNGEITFAFNRIYNIFEQTSWRPTYYISQDEKMLSGCIDTVNSCGIKTKFVPIQLKWYYDLDVNRAVYFNIQNQNVDDPLDFKFSDDISRGIYNSSTCMYTAAQIAAYMGFKEIYLIGVDHHFRVSQNNNGEVIVDNTVKDYFSEKYNEDKDKLYIPNTEKSTLTYIAMKQHCEQRGIKVYNATRGGRLEVFDRVDFDSLFECKDN